MTNIEIRKNFKKNFIVNEFDLCSEIKSENFVSVSDIFAAEKYRNDRISLYTKELLKKLQEHYPFIQSISFSVVDGFSILLQFENGKFSMISLQNEDRLTFLYDTEIPIHDQRKILEKYSGELKDLINFGLENNYINQLNLKTISGSYELNIIPTRFSIFRPHWVTKLDKKRLEFNYFYTQNVSTILTKKIQTDLGIFNVRTNITGIKHIIKNTKKSSNKTMKNFLENLKVYESDIPEYLKPEIEKVKVLKK